MAHAIHKILFPTDFGPSSPNAAAYAGVIAESLDASVHFVHVLEESRTTSGGWHLERTNASRLRDEQYYDCRAKLRALAASLNLAPDRVTIEVRTGTPADAIVDAAIDYGVDLIVMSTPERRGLPNLVMGSVADRVLRRARCPVLAVRQSGAGPGHAGRLVA